MKVIIEYQCEICLKKYSTESEALKCESKGVFDGKNYPAGLMFEYTHSGYVGIFAIPETVQPYEMGRKWGDGHLGKSSYWACRDGKYSADSLGAERCGGDFFRSDNEYFKHWVNNHAISDKYVNGPEFTRMVEFLKSKGITPTYYNSKLELVTIGETH